MRINRSKVRFVLKIREGTPANDSSVIRPKRSYNRDFRVPIKARVRQIVQYIPT